MAMFCSNLGRKKDCEEQVAAIFVVRRMLWRSCRQRVEEALSVGPDLDTFRLNSNIVILVGATSIIHSVERGPQLFH